MKRCMLLILSAALVISAGCGSEKKNDETKKILESEIAGEITVSCYDAMLYKKFLEEAAVLFESKYPGTKINVEVFSKMPEVKTQTLEDGSMVSYTEDSDSPEDRTNYINRMNTELMSGQGADILAMDILPYYKFAESGQLEDLNRYMNADEGFDLSGYKSNIIEGTRYKEGQYIIPLDFGYEFYSFDKSRVSGGTAQTLRAKDRFTYWELTDLIMEQFSNDESGARVIDFQGGAQQAFNFMLSLDYDKYINLENKKANFTDGEFVQILNKIKEQKDGGYFVPDFSTSEESVSDFVEGQRLYYYKMQIDMILRDVFYPHEDVTEGAFPTPEIDEIVGLLTNDDGDVRFRCYQAYGINANSENKKLAWEFIKFLLGEEMQLSLNLLGKPVNNAAFVENSKLYFTKMPDYTPVDENDLDGEYVVTGYREITDEKIVSAYEQYYERLSSFVNALNHYPARDEIIDDMLASETALFFSGERSAEETAEALQNKVQLYLDE